MSEERPPLVSMVLVAKDGVRHLAGVLTRVFTHRWVASYQIGFGPPLVRSSDRLITRVRQAKGVLEKLEAYVECCFLNDDERRRLLGTHRRLFVRARGPVDIESLDEASAEVLDLSLRLHHPALAPPAVAAAMRDRGVPHDVVPMKSPPDALSARVHVRLSDPRGERLFHADAVKAVAFDPETDLGLELRVPPAVRPLFGAFFDVLASSGGLAWVELGDPLSRAKVTVDGQRS